MAINLGSTAIADAKLGTTQVEKIYLGSEQIWGGSPTPAGPDYGEVVLYGYTVTQTELGDVTPGWAVNVANENAIKQFIDPQLYTLPVTFDVSGDDLYDWTTWMIEAYDQMGERITIDSNMFNEMFTIAPEEPIFDSFSFTFSLMQIGSTVIDTTTTTTRTLASANEFDQLASADGITVLTDVPVLAVKEVKVGKLITSVPLNFLRGGENLDSFAFASDNHVSSIGGNFLYNCKTFNQPIALPEGLTSTPISFLLNCRNFNSTVTLPSTLTSIGGSFLGTCTSFNQPITIPSSVTSIGTSFLASCSSFTQSITLPSGLTSIGEFFMTSCTSFNQPLTIPSSVTSIGAHFLYACRVFNQPITIPTGVTEITYNFMAACLAMNSTVTLPNTLTKIGTNFLYGCSAFNKPLSIPNSVTSISGAFLQGDVAFNQRITLPSSLQTIASDFMRGTAAYDNYLVVPEGVTSIGNNFMRGSHVTSVTLPSTLKTIGTYFLAECNYFSQDVVLPASLTSVNTYFMYDARNMTGTINLGNLSYGIFVASNQTLSSYTNNSPMYTSGVQIKGTDRASFMSRFANRTSRPYRKLIDGGA